MAAPDTARSAAVESELSEFERLRRFLRYHLGRFTLGLVRVNNPRQRDGIIASLADVLAAEGAQLERIDLANRHPATLRDALESDPVARQVLANPARAALAIVGLDHLIETEADESGRPPFAAALNLERDALRQALPLPIILFLTDHAMDRLDLAAPDFFDWYSGIFHFRPAQPIKPGMAVPTEVPTSIEHEPPPDDGGSSLSREIVAERLDLLEERRLDLAHAGAEARQRLAQVLEEMGELYANLPEFHNRQLAVSYLRQAAEIFHEEEQRGDEAEALENLGTVYYWINNYKQAMRRYEEALPIYREIGARLGEANCIKQLGDVHLSLSELPQARARYEEALPIYREIGDRLGEANTYTAFGNLSLAEEVHTNARDWYEQAWLIYREIGERLWLTYLAPRLARTWLNLGEVDKAEETLVQGATLARTIAGKPNLQSILWLLANVHKTQEGNEAALACYDELLVLAPDDEDYIRGRASVLFERGEYVRTLADYRHLLALNPDDAWAYNGVGNVRDQQHNYENALAAYSQAITIEPAEPVFYRNRASALIALNRLEEALEDCETAARLAPEHPYTQGRWGDLHLARGMWSEAEMCYRAALAEDNNAGWRFGLVVALWGQGCEDEGWNEFNNALTQADTGELTEAIHDYRRLQQLHPSFSEWGKAVIQLRDQSEQV